MSTANLNLVDILLVEDNNDDAELTIREIRKHHIVNQLLHINDSEEALDFLFESGRSKGPGNSFHQPKLVLLDMQMPKLNGLQVLKQIKSDERTKDIYVVMLVGSKDDPHIKQCYALGADSCMTKPVNLERFSEATQNLGFSWLLVDRAIA